MQIISILGLGKQTVRHFGLKYFLCNEQCFLHCPSFFGIKIPLSMQECRSPLNTLTLAFLLRRSFILPGLIKILSNIWSICSAGWRVGWVVKFIWIGDLMNKSISYRCLKKIPPPELFLVRFIMKKNNPGQCLVNAQLQLRFIQSVTCLDIHSFHETQTWEITYMYRHCVLYLFLCNNIVWKYVFCVENQVSVSLF